MKTIIVIIVALVLLCGSVGYGCDTEKCQIYNCVAPDGYYHITPKEKVGYDDTCYCISESYNGLVTSQCKSCNNGKPTYWENKVIELQQQLSELKAQVEELRKIIRHRHPTNIYGEYLQCCSDKAECESYGIRKKTCRDNCRCGCQK